MDSYKKRIAEIRERVENTKTKGPWKMVMDKPKHGIPMPIIIDSEDEPVMEALHKGISKPGDTWIDVYEQDAELMAHAREDIPFLLDRVEYLEDTLRKVHRHETYALLTVEEALGRGKG